VAVTAVLFVTGPKGTNVAVGALSEGALLQGRF
jgi:hypothetical protein